MPHQVPKAWAINYMRYLIFILLAVVFTNCTQNGESSTQAIQQVVDLNETITEQIDTSFRATIRFMENIPGEKCNDTIPCHQVVFISKGYIYTIAIVRNEEVPTYLASRRLKGTYGIEDVESWTVDGNTGEMYQCMNNVYNIYKGEVRNNKDFEVIDSVEVQNLSAYFIDIHLSTIKTMKKRFGT